MSRVTELTAYQNRRFQGSCEFWLSNNGGPLPLPGTYELRLFRHNNTTPFATGSIGNGKITLTLTGALSRLEWNFPPADMAALEGYGSAEFIETGNIVPVVVIPLRFVKEGTPYVREFGEDIAIFAETAVCVVEPAVPGTQLAMQWKDEGVGLGNPGEATNIDITGTGVSAAFASGTLTIIIPGGHAPDNAEYLVASANGTLTAERVATATPTISFDMATAGQWKANVVDSSITLAKMANLAANSVLANITGAPATPQAAARASFVPWLALAAGEVANTPAGGVAATTVQAAINELDTEKLDKSGGTVSGNLTITGNLTLNGSTFQVNATTVTYDDIILVIGGDTAPVADDAKDRGIEFRWHNGAAAKLGFFGWDRSAQELTFIPDATDTADVISGTAGTIRASLNGNAASASIWQTGRTITLTGMVTGVSGAFDGSANLSFAAALGSFTMAQLDAAVSDGNVSYAGHTHTSAAITDFQEASEDVVGALLTASEGTGDLDWTYTDAGGSLNAVVKGNAITFAKMQDIATARFIGRVTASSGDPEELTGAQATTLLDVFAPSGVGSKKGLVPDPGASAGNTKFLREDGAWAVPAGGGGGGTPGGINGQIQYNNAGALGGFDMSGDVSVVPATGAATIANDAVSYAKMQNVSATARVLGRKTAGAGDVEELSKSDLLALLGIGQAELASDNTVNTTALADVTGLSFTAEANSVYLVEVIGTFRVAVSSTGIGIALNIPSGAVQGLGTFTSNQAAQFQGVQQVADDALLTITQGVDAANTDYPFHARFLVSIEGSGGTVQLRQKSEVASNSVLRAKAAGVAGTIMRWTKMS